MQSKSTALEILPTQDARVRSGKDCTCKGPSAAYLVIPVFNQCTASTFADSFVISSILMPNYQDHIGVSGEVSLEMGSV
jgi:hypothetical protein